MVANQLVARGIHDQHVLQAFAEIPRHLFVPLEARQLAYGDHPLPIGAGQTISQPYIVAYMLQVLGLNGDETVLEIGTGSGYEAALLGKLAAQVHTIERIPTLAETARQILQQLAASNVSVHVGDGSAGLAAFAPYQAIVSSAGAPRVPQPLLEQLTDGGRLLLPVGEPGAQVLQFWRRQGVQFTHRQLGDVAFVSLIGRYGWQSDQ
jgi:protein-L-isoaspartate(D-aspartate) O-methyltransferase